MQLKILLPLKSFCKSSSNILTISDGNRSKSSTQFYKIK